MSRSQNDTPEKPELASQVETEDAHEGVPCDDSGERASSFGNRDDMACSAAASLLISTAFVGLSSSGLKRQSVSEVCRMAENEKASSQEVPYEKQLAMRPLSSPVGLEPTT